MTEVSISPPSSRTQDYVDSASYFASGGTIGTLVVTMGQYGLSGGEFFADGNLHASSVTDVSGTASVTIVFTSNGSVLNSGSAGRSFNSFMPATFDTTFHATASLLGRECGIAAKSQMSASAALKVLDTKMVVIPVWSDQQTKSGTTVTFNDCQDQYQYGSNMGQQTVTDNCAGTGTYEWYHWTGTSYQDMGEVCGYTFMGAKFENLAPASTEQHSDVAHVAIAESPAPIPVAHARIVRRADKNPATVILLDKDANAQDLTLAMGAFGLLRMQDNDRPGTQKEFDPRGRLAVTGGAASEIAGAREILSGLRSANAAELPGIGFVHFVIVDAGVLPKRR